MRGEARGSVVARSRRGERPDRSPRGGRGASGERIAPLPTGQARVAEGHDVRGSLSGAGKGAVAGGILGAIGGAISGAIQGSIYHPEGSYETLAMLLTEYSSGRTLPERATIAPVE